MNKNIISVLIAGLLVLLVSLGILYIGIFAFPSLMEEYYNSVFRSSSFDTDWLFYAHPFVLSAALKWFWDRSRDSFKGSLISKAARVSLAYGLVAMLPVLWLTFSAIDVSFIMVITWLTYGYVQSLIATVVFAKMNG
ncbi:MAG: hypothetical protein MUC73_04510 [Cyclobacteriaceae bacterium]|nr:hypothetical protein [Cyclobacteriaceae bacterium]